MTDQPPAAPAATPPGAPPEGDPPADTTDPADAAETSTDGSPDEDGKLRKEAARYRLALRAAEGERDALSTRVAAMQRAEVERLAAEDLDKPADLWVLGTALPDLLDDAGAVDPDRVAEMVQRIVADRPGWRRTRPVSFDGGPRAAPPSSGAGWSDLLGGRAPRR